MNCNRFKVGQASRLPGKRPSASERTALLADSPPQAGETPALLCGSRKASFRLCAGIGTMNPPLTHPRRGTDRTRTNTCSHPGRERRWVGSWKASGRRHYGIFRWAARATLLGAIGAPRPMLACAACFGKSDSNLAQGMNWGIVTLLAVVVFVLGSITAFFIFLARRAAVTSQAINQTAESTALSREYPVHERQGGVGLLPAADEGLALPVAPECALGRRDACPTLGSSPVHGRASIEP